MGPLELSGTSPLFASLPVSCHQVAPQRIAHSPFNKAFSGGARIHPYVDLQDFFWRIAGCPAGLRIFKRHGGQAPHFRMKPAGAKPVGAAGAAAVPANDTGSAV